jgi:threonylcarbamoyladenosine tRNA methylthiotransferase MtaB
VTDFSVDFLGCKISQTDAEAVREALQQAGHSEASSAAVRVVNTCCITAEAERKSRKKVRRLASDADAKVFVTGCGATLRPESYSQLGDNVVALPGAAASHAAAIVSAADELAGLGCKGPAPGTVERRRTRAFVKIQDGCSFGCSYCIVPTVRGDSRSRSLERVLDEVARRVHAGQREIVLTGVNIGLYRDPESRASLPTLARRVADVSGVARVRISSIEVNHVNRRLVDAIAGHPKLCAHLHVPLQSGDDAVLADMHRHYDTRRYRRAIELARGQIPGLNLTTDIIVGYPTESEASFARTLAFAREMRFTKVHAFPFSPRPGTEAERDADPVSRDTKRARSLALRTQADEFATQHWRERIGRPDQVIVEPPASRPGMTLTSAHSATGSGEAGVIHGYTYDYCPVRFAAPPDPRSYGQLVDVILTGHDGDALTAAIA